MQDPEISMAFVKAFQESVDKLMVTPSSFAEAFLGKQEVKLLSIKITESYGAVKMDEEDKMVTVKVMTPEQEEAHFWKSL